MSTEPMPVEMLLSCLIPFRGDSHMTHAFHLSAKSLLFLKEAEMSSAWFAMF